MYSIYVLIILLTKVLSMQYLPKETILQLDTSSSGYLYLKKEDFGLSEVNILFRTYKSKMDLNISYIETNENPNSDDQFNDYKSKNCISHDTRIEPYLYIFEFSQINRDYLVLKYSGFSGSSITVACSKYKELGTYIPKRKEYPHTSNSLDIFIFFKYEDFFNSNDIYVIFEFNGNAMKRTIEYQNTNVDPSLIISYSNLTIKSPDRDYSTKSPQQYYFTFPYSNYKYLIIYYHLNMGVKVTISSSNKISYTQITNTINNLSKFNYGYLYLAFKDFETYDDIYIYFQISEGNINNYIQYDDSNSLPEYEEDLSSMQKKLCDITTNESNQQKIYSSEFQKKDHQYLIIKYSDFSGDSISVAGSTKIRYLSNDNEIILPYSSIKYGYIFLNYSDFANSDSNEIYLYFKFSGKKINEKISYRNSEIVPIYAGQFSDMYSKNYDKKEERYSNYYKYIYVFQKTNNNYLVIKYEDFNGDSLTIFSSSINLMPTLLPKEETITLNNPSKTGFIYLKNNDFDYDDMIYIYFETPGKIDSNIRYLYTDEDPSYGENFTSLQTKGYDKIDEESEYKRYSFKFNGGGLNYLLIKYSGFNGNELTVTSTTRDPFLLSVVAIVFIVIVCILVFAGLIVVVFFFKSKRKTKYNNIEDVKQTKAYKKIEYNISPIPLVE